jgi:hypothetical protein
MMKFPRPRKLEINEYPDLTTTQPELLKYMVNNFISPPPGSDIATYIDQTIQFLKTQHKEKTIATRVNNININRTLPFVSMKIPPFQKSIQCLVDTGAANSLLHSDIAKQLPITIQATSIKLVTATGSSNTAVQGIAHIYFELPTSSKKIVNLYCTTFIVTNQLNGLQAILGAEFLLNPNKVSSISASKLSIKSNNKTIQIPLLQQLPPATTIPDNHSTNNIVVETEQSSEIFSSYNIHESLENETLPPAEEMFNDHQTLEFESLDKTFTINDGYYSECPPEHYTVLMKLMSEFKDRFSTSKLDLETTEIYEAKLPTLPGKIVNQKCRRLPHHKYQFAIKAIGQLEKAGVVRKSDSPWRSNVVLVPKPSEKNELRENSKASQLTGEHNMSKLYRLCLDFRELNSILDFPQQTQFTTIDDFLHTLKGKVCVSLDISSSFFIIPIAEEDRYKTAFWVNNLAFEFANLVMGLKSSPYHLNKFIEKAFSQEVHNDLLKQLPSDQQKLVPPSFDHYLRSYFDDKFIFADNYESLYVCFKMVLMAARKAKIKYSIEKSSFFTTKLKILGYSFDTKDVHLTMDKLKASGFLNTKKPSSLYELHSRLAAF